MKFYRNSRQAAQTIVDAFRTGRLPEPLAQIFISRAYDQPMSHWSFSNQFLCAVAGASDARGYRQWLQAGRHVRKGQHAIAHILVPLIHKQRDDDTDEVVASIIYGFTSSPVFDVTQTDGDPLPGADNIIADLPLVDVARAWDVHVTVYAGQEGRALGQYSYSGDGRKTIALGVENLSTWAHELIHAADHRLGNLENQSKRWQAEVIAELGGATLLTMIGEETAADIGGAWDYIQNYADQANVQPITACTQTIDRLCNCIDLILQTAVGHAPAEPNLLYESPGFYQVDGPPPDTRQRCDDCGRPLKSVHFVDQDILCGPAWLCRPCLTQIRRSIREEKAHLRQQSARRLAQQYHPDAADQLALFSYHNGREFDPEPPLLLADEPEPEEVPASPHIPCHECLHDLRGREAITNGQQSWCLDCFERLNGLQTLQLDPSWLQTHLDSLPEDVCLVHYPF